MFFKVTSLNIKNIYLSFFSKLQGARLQYYKVTINNRAQT